MSPVRYDAAHALLLHPGTSRPWVVHPFALSPGSCWVQTNDTGYWANCLYCACGIAAALECDATIHTRYGGEAQPVVYQVRNGLPAAAGAAHTQVKAVLPRRSAAAPSTVLLFGNSILIGR